MKTADPASEQPTSEPTPEGTPAWPRYGVMASTYAVEQRREGPSRPVVAGAGRVFATHAEAVMAVGAAEDVEELIPLALRRWRREHQMSQRAAAAQLDVPPGQFARAESSPAQLKLGTVVSLLRSAGYALRVVDADGIPLAGDVRAAEALPRTRAGARFPATAAVVRLGGEPRWMAERGQSFQLRGPQWTGERRPGQYP
ncbi:helix-turn-helix domain-containing protein [Ornithinimicrobium tianjinense]|uniref:Helix-turn-helix domain-containing protein n=1 Tax=Ornithinimicrobium tianjinense TaxID=1195761 RepID=A0A917BQN4_9MICO|nr:helix-turn-helix transcriptional regulator [Ornithinimicrobium tianjinense]GGF53150.1 hypothetical protein GCM10011366_21160 [Ornithinimicrobium tianjinense]